MNTRMGNVGFWCLLKELARSLIKFVEKGMSMEDKMLVIRQLEASYEYIFSEGMVYSSGNQLTLLRRRPLIRKHMELFVTVPGFENLVNIQVNLDLQDLDIVSSLNALLKYSCSKKCIVAYESFFNTTPGYSEQKDYYTYQAVTGFKQVLQSTTMGMSLCLDIFIGAFYPAMIVDHYVERQFIQDYEREISTSYFNKVRNDLKGLSVTYGNELRAKITDITQLPLGQMSIRDATDTQCSLVSCLEVKHDTKLHHTLWPALMYYENGGDTAYLAMEACSIAYGQPKKVTDMPRFVRNMLPAERRESIMYVSKKSEKDNLAEEFGIIINPEMTRINARLLPSPSLEYRGTTLMPKDGRWDISDAKLFRGVEIAYWTCVNFSTVESSEVEKFAADLMKTCCKKGMIVDEKPYIPIRTRTKEQIDSALKELHNISGGMLQILIIILPDSTGSSYDKIKSICELELGIMSQCCRPCTVLAPAATPTILNHLAMKINVKVGGVNAILKGGICRSLRLQTDVPTIIFGADVTHPARGDRTSDSIAAVVASINYPEMATYAVELIAQPHRQEIMGYLPHKSDIMGHSSPHTGVDEYVEIFRRHLMSFKAANSGTMPGRIIFYRDGVSDSQFQDVLDKEVKAIREACISINSKYKPPIIVIVVQKRHRTRFFPTDDNKTMNDNILPGTVVDSGICMDESDFYLCSHDGTRGLSRPGHYRVLLNEDSELIRPDDLSRLTFDLCHMYAYSTCAVSLVAPVYYAHLAAYRARSYMKGRRSLPEVNSDMKHTMFFC
ncbi:Protein argonaute MEL1 [Linum grandiflorum]